MCKIVWLDDEPESISYEKNVLIPDKFSQKKIDIYLCETIDELLEKITQDDFDEKSILLIDIMLLSEESFTIPAGDKIPIENDLMAGTILYREYLRDNFPSNPIILYTSREHEKDIFNHITNDEKYNQTLFLLEKSKKDTDLLEVLSKFI